MIRTSFLGLKNRALCGQVDSHNVLNRTDLRERQSTIYVVMHQPYAYQSTAPGECWAARDRHVVIYEGPQFQTPAKKVVNASNIKRSHRFDYENAHPSENVIVAAVDYMAHGGMYLSPSILQTGTGSSAPAIKAFCDRVHIPAKKGGKRER